MSAPVVHPFTSKWYGLLPDVYKDADLAPGGVLDYPLLRFISLLGDLAGLTADMIDRVDYWSPADGGPADGRSDLVDPDNADLAWLPWLAQLVGVHLSGQESEASQRSLINSAGTGWRSGTKASIAAAAATALTGTQYVEVLDHRTSSGTGTQWDVLVLTRGIETPSDQAVLDAITLAGVKPAGVKLWMGRTAASWDLLESRYTTSDAWDATGSWDAIESTQ